MFVRVEGSRNGLSRDDIQWLSLLGVAHLPDSFSLTPRKLMRGKLLMKYIYTIIFT